MVYDAARRDAVSRLISDKRDEACTTFAYRSIEDLTAFTDRHTGPSSV